MSREGGIRERTGTVTADSSAPSVATARAQGWRSWAAALTLQPGC